MTPERRTFPRFESPINGWWRNASADIPCTIADLSWGGCSVVATGEPAIGDETVITIPTPSGDVKLAAKIVHIERGKGFAVQFQSMNQSIVDALYLKLGEPVPNTTRPINDWIG